MRDRKARILSETVLGAVLASLLVPGVVGAGQYTVRPGDTLYLIAQRYGTTVDTLRRTNGIWTDDLYPGQALNVPGSAGSGSSGFRNAGNGGYTVQPGDTLFLIAQRYGTTVDALRQANGIWSDTLYPGQTLAIPSSGGGSRNSGGGGGYTVQPGDTLFLIAQRYGTTVDALRQANGIWSDVLYPGQVLAIPSAGDGYTRPSGGQVVEPGAGGDNAVWGSKYVITRQGYELLARLVSAEAQGEPYAGQVAVAATVLRRMTDPRFPATLEGIIYQVWDRYYYQYSPVENGTINNPAVPSAYRAVEEALNGADPSYGANGFYNPRGTENTWVTQQPVTTVIGNHVFFKS
ncbi:MAG TPA: LysM peptidoglycan-binding domain-containing protein [Firmicutes bacterium]|nr:LysM peptidoglycan-binding domain-containing protein [Bacillota bacterium]